MIAIDFVRDHAGHITDHTTTYGFPNGAFHDGSEYEVTNFSYTSRGFLDEYETVGELLTGSFAEGYEHSRDVALGSTVHLYETDGGLPLWSGLRNPDGRLTNVMTDHYSWSFDYDADGKMVEYATSSLNTTRGKISSPSTTQIPGKAIGRAMFTTMPAVSTA